MWSVGRLISNVLCFQHIAILAEVFEKVVSLLCQPMPQPGCSAAHCCPAYYVNTQTQQGSLCTSEEQSSPACQIGMGRSCSPSYRAVCSAICSPHADGTQASARRVRACGNSGKTYNQNSAAYDSPPLRHCQAAPYQRRRAPTRPTMGSHVCSNIRIADYRMLVAKTSLVLPQVRSIV